MILYIVLKYSNQIMRNKIIKLIEAVFLTASIIQLILIFLLIIKLITE